MIGGTPPPPFCIPRGVHTLSGEVNLGQRHYHPRPCSEAVGIVGLAEEGKRRLLYRAEHEIEGHVRTPPIVTALPASSSTPCRRGSTCTAMAARPPAIMTTFPPTVFTPPPLLPGGAAGAGQSAAGGGERGGGGKATRVYGACGLGTLSTWPMYHA